MFRNAIRPVRGGRSTWIAVGCLVVLLSATAVVRTQQPAAAPAQQAAPAKSPYVFGGDAAMILNFIKADKAADFEMVVGRLKESLAKSENPQRKQQAASWKFFKAAEPGPGGSVIYVSIMEPVVKGADYSVSNILAEALPTEVQALYKSYSEAFGTPSQNMLNLTMTADLSK
jgi:hypothetical protein